MPDSGTYVPSPWDWVREQVEEYEASGGTRANTLLDTGMPIIVVTTRGARTGAVRKTPRGSHSAARALLPSPPPSPPETSGRW